VPTSSNRRREAQCPSIIAGKIIECANCGDTSLSRLTEVGYAAAMQLATGQIVRACKGKQAAN
jgi:hypothetical protein